MSTIDIGSVDASVNDEDTQITVEYGKGWGGNGVAPYNVLLYVDTKKMLDKDYVMMCLTSEDARNLASLLNATADIADMEEEE